MENKIVLEEKECEIKETGEKVKYIACIWKIGSQSIQLKPVFKNDKSAIKVLADTGVVDYTPLKEV